MDKDTVIKVENLSKKFCRSIKRSMFYGSLDVAKNMLGIKVNTEKLRKDEFWALENVNFDVKKGETFGIIGANGSGKTTLLRMITGIFPPDKGKIAVKGRIGALIAVGAGFHPHMTGRENIFLNGAILGMSREDIDRHMDDIINFAEIGDFLDAPVSTYSSGMYVRLGFAIAIHSLPDIVLVDEILAVGDPKFQRKCLDKIRDMKKKGVTFIIISHNLLTIESTCERVLFLNKGKQVMLGLAEDVVPSFELFLQENIESNEEEIKSNEIGDGLGLDFVKKYKEYGTEEILVTELKLKNCKGEIKKEFNSDESLTLELKIKSGVSVDKMILWMSFIYINDYKVDDNNLKTLGIRENISINEGEETLRIIIEKIQLTTGKYKISVAFFDESFINPYFQCQFGYLGIKKNVATLLRVGQQTPIFWTKPKIERLN